MNTTVDNNSLNLIVMDKTFVKVSLVYKVIEEPIKNGKYSKKQVEYMIQHNIDIVDDNWFHGVKYGESDEELREYLEKCEIEEDAFEAHLKKGGLAAYNLDTDMYVIAQI